jgi:exopolysaccharide production protein ExoZ
LKASPTDEHHFHLHTTVPLPSKIRQIDGLQILRAVAVILVAWLHAGLNLAITLPNFGIFGIDIFFVISGFIMSSILLHNKNGPSAGEAWEFFKRRLIRIYPIYWLFAIVQTIRLYHNGILFQHNFVPSYFLLPLPWSWRIYDLSWTMMFEMFFYSILAALLLISVKRAVPVAIALFCLTVAIGAFTGIARPLPIIVSNPILLEFVAGACVALAFYRFRVRRRFGIAMLAAGVVFSLYLRAYPPPGASSFQMILTGQAIFLRVFTWGIAATMLVGGMVFWSPTIKSRLGIIAVVLGNSSYSAYLASTVVLEFSLRLLLKLFPSAAPQSALRTLIYQTFMVVAVLAVGWLSYQFVEWPLVRSLQRRLK